MSTSSSDDGKSKWDGRERRSGGERRKNNDRRDDIRFEPKKIDRRSGVDRRHDRRGGWNDVTPRR